MSARSLNKVQLIGNLTRDPELRYTPSGAAVCTLGLATNRSWTTDTGERKEDVEYHRLVAWNKLAELCSQLLGKGRKIYVEGRLQTRNWTSQDGKERSTTEIVLDDMIILDSKRAYEESRQDYSEPPAPIDNTGSSSASMPTADDAGAVEAPAKKKKAAKEEKTDAQSQPSEEVNVDDIPF